MTTNDQSGPEPRSPKSRRRPRRNAAGLDAPTLGYIPATPSTPAPVLADPMGDAAAAYAKTIDRLQVASEARVVLITAGDPGLGATLATINLGMAAIRLGLRTVVIDGDAGGTGPSRYLRTGAAPGLTDVADGSSDLRAASRLLEIGSDHRLPLIPAGGPKPNGVFSATDLADAIDVITEHADLVLVCVPFDIDEMRLASLAAHADGSVIVLTQGDHASTAAETAARVAQAGAPVIGVVELAASRRRGLGRR